MTIIKEPEEAEKGVLFDLVDFIRRWVLEVGVERLPPVNRREVNISSGLGENSVVGIFLLV